MPKRNGRQSQNNNQTRIAIIGLGLIGGSLAKALHKLKAEANMETKKTMPHVVAYDKDKKTIARATKEGFIDEKANSYADAVENADIVVLAVPAGAMEQAFIGIKDNLKSGAIVTDVFSVKQPVMEMAQKIMPNVIFVGGHPIAGSAEGGIENSRANLFTGRSFILTPGKDTPEEAVERIQELWDSFKANTEIMDAAAHDRTYAYVSHLPQMLAFAVKHSLPDLMAHKKPESDRTQLQEFLRLTASDPEMWRGTLLLNRDNAAEALGAYCKKLEEFVRKLTPANEDTAPDDGSRETATLTLFPWIAAKILDETVRSADPEFLPYAGTGYTSFTKPLNAQNESMETSIARNAHQLRIPCAAYLKQLRHIEQALQGGREDALATALSSPAAGASIAG